jgi:acyl-CoA synthetase (AMP-forming)/AMP-acid ligase II
MIMTGGRNVAPAEVADALADHPAVADVAVCGLPDVEWGERVVALVVPRDRAPTLDDVRRWVAERLAAYKAPRAIIAVDAIPRDARGKVLREELRRLATAAQPREP